MALDSDTFDMLLDTVRRFVSERLIPREAEVVETNSIPDDVVRGMKELGIFGLSIAEEFGGLGLSMEEEVRVVFELGRASPAFRSVAGTNIGIGSQSIVIAGTQEQKEKYLPALASGDLIGSFALTEPDAGSDAMALRTTARRDGDQYVINGTKRYITNAPSAGLFSVMARTAPERKADSISCFLIEADTPGIKLGLLDKKMGQRGALTCDVVFEDCRVPASALLGNQEGNGFRTAMKVLDKGRLHIAALCVGIADRLIQESVAYAKDRKQFGQPIAEFQLIQAMLADSEADTYAARCMILDAAARRDRGENTTRQAACAKMFASEMVGRVADRAVQIFGGAGYMSEYPVERFYRDVRLFRIFEGTTQIQQLVIARELLKAAS
ncbi:acyl-CoA dehydrogenase family protein (plasmid) [Agrobacterium leguminum]|uniref:Acyl-CoA dehydrogenase YngJ n=1 Tax=Agrobacterium deltaense NCPPB 1641 TaxID=1183425 RepID=A0A1S7U974_9HYPH|nr:MULTISPECIES: acyl-CoA dehydrogenase family protein [Agrobacterium]WFS70055.1 acyl-CoA dehydrogenase family protein [Agrobacterium leguminum]CVI63369.1 putative acyl-CoA dehydrogenase YngJ [Agrobacterium deltaense NCPPB 1641]